MHIIRLFKNGVIQKKKMAAKDQVVVVVLCSALLWFCRPTQHHSAAIARDAAARRQMTTVCQLQDEPALVAKITMRRLLVRVQQRRSLWMKPRSQVFFKRCCSWMRRSAMEEKLQNQQGYTLFSSHPALISSPAKTFSANALIC